MNELNFDSLKPIEILVRYQGKLYYLVEADAESGAEYRDRIISGTRLEDSKAVGISGIPMAQLSLVARCLFQSDSVGDKTDQRVNINTLRKWPDRVIRKLFEKLEEISELDREDLTSEDGDPAGNGPTATTDGSE